MASLSPTSSVRPTTTTAVDNGQTRARAQLTQLAASQVRDPHAAELSSKVDRLVHDRFHGDYRAAFQHYAGSNGEVSRDGINRLLSDAGVGNFLTRGAWTDGVMDRFDANRNGSVSWGEFTGAMRQNGVNVSG